MPRLLRQSEEEGGKGMGPEPLAAAVLERVRIDKMQVAS